MTDRIPVHRGTPVRRVLLLTHSAPQVTDHALPAVLSLLEAAGIEVLVPPAEVEKHARLGDLGSSDGVTLGPDGDLILVLGGDGSMLRALARESGLGAPVIGINFGRVGFLAAIEPAELEAGLTRALRGDYLTLGLPSLKAWWRDGEVSAVNDLALLRGGESRLADLTFSIDGERVAQIRCDGLICSTPVGSTAYNLAAGGPTVSWKVRCFVISFMAAHHLDTRPIVIAPEETLTVTNSAVVGDCDVMADGQRIGALGPGRSIALGLSGAEVHLAVFPEHSFFRRYREKFGRP
ncbi:MAG: NAD(+)/NADH kinase [Actinomycetota bacterium]